MLFITNRFPKGSIQSRVGRPFAFDLKNNAPSNSIFFCERNADGSMVELGGMNFLTKLKGCPVRQVLLYIHGFSNLPETVFAAASEFQLLCDQKDDKEVVVVPVIWPCDNDLGIVQDYWDDQKSADFSAPSLARALCRFLEWRESSKNDPSDPCLKRINVLAHSMGNRVLRETLCAWDRYDLTSGVPLMFRNAFLVAADIENESIHRDQKGKLISDASRNVVVYFAADDLALRASKAANLKNKIASRRLGHTGPENFELTPQNVYCVDCDDVNNDYDPPKGHSYFRAKNDAMQPGKVFEHIFQCLQSGRVPIENPDRRLSILHEEAFS
ncbi:alpha/beta hydrolase [Chitinolyticbacter meiyuanensis]|uniref:alpha/beta hydrolase n=1 Tax=Chitinolyticbacter meiyuanensis TaxID=682798 RepID=UPI0011E5E6C7|nr:alpha/beta hydrolase [Chitinolyticbacter meiyuanensis]